MGVGWCEVSLGVRQSTIADKTTRPPIPNRKGGRDLWNVDTVNEL